MAWDDVVDSSSCITPSEWNDMITYIKSMGCESKGEVTFYLYSDCSNSTGQKFKFDFSGDDSRICGGSTTGDDLVIHANSVDTYPFIQLEGNGEIYLDVANDEEIVFREGGSQSFLFDHTFDQSYIYGGNAAGANLLLYANSTDTYPYINLDGDNVIILNVSSDKEIIFKEGGSQFFNFDHSGDDSLLYGGSTTGDDLKIIANSTDTYPFLLMEGHGDVTVDSYGDIYFKEQGTQSFKFVYATNVSSIYGGSTTGDDLHLRANTSDSSPSLTLEGAGNINFHCNQSEEFRLENRTTDPASPCTGQLWFRTDLV